MCSLLDFGSFTSCKKSLYSGDRGLFSHSNTNNHVKTWASPLSCWQQSKRNFCAPWSPAQIHFLWHSCTPRSVPFPLTSLLFYLVAMATQCCMSAFQMRWHCPTVQSVPLLLHHQSCRKWEGTGGCKLRWLSHYPIKTAINKQFFRKIKSCPNCLPCSVDWCWDKLL